MRRCRWCCNVTLNVSPNSFYFLYDLPLKNQWLLVSNIFSLSLRVYQFHYPSFFSQQTCPSSRSLNLYNLDQFSDFQGLPSSSVTLGRPSRTILYNSDLEQFGPNQKTSSLLLNMCLPKKLNPMIPL